MGAILKEGPKDERVQRENRPVPPTPPVPLREVDDPYYMKKGPAFLPLSPVRDSNGL